MYKITNISGLDKYFEGKGGKRIVLKPGEFTLDMKSPGDVPYYKVELVEKLEETEINTKQGGKKYGRNK